MLNLSLKILPSSSPRPDLLEQYLSLEPRHVCSENENLFQEIPDLKDQDPKNPALHVLVFFYLEIVSFVVFFLRALYT